MNVATLLPAVASVLVFVAAVPVTVVSAMSALSVAVAYLGMAFSAVVPAYLATSVVPPVVLHFQCRMPAAYLLEALSIDSCRLYPDLSSPVIWLDGS